MTVTKRELVGQVASKLGMQKSDVSTIIDSVFETMIGGLAEGERWEFRGFGVFDVKTRLPKVARNPKTGEQVTVPKHKVVTFRPGQKMKDEVGRISASK